MVCFSKDTSCETSNDPVDLFQQIANERSTARAIELPEDYWSDVKKLKLLVHQLDMIDLVQFKTETERAACQPAVAVVGV